MPIAMIDADTQLIPDSIVLPLRWIGPAMSLWHPMAGATTLFIAPQDAIVGAMAGGLAALCLVLWARGGDTSNRGRSSWTRRS